ncbi:uncharacterized protein LOC112565344 [Pomacea canaliculata]|uniref:uncharacterized protein LOC112565344 n=1 Tax=Pomacea canaliculata TaxID=400727 RepID=UPI000D730698|nr:uncharacterized protein LOC112565344 [Pomacea canaliculata]
MTSADVLDLSHQQYPGLRSGPTFQRPPPQLNGLTALDQRSRRRRPGRLSTPVPSVPCALDGVRVRRMGMRDLQTVKTLMRSEGWNVDFGNMAAVFRIQPAAFFVVETATGDVIGHCSACVLDKEVAMLSYLLVDNQHQKQGLGSLLMQAAALVLGSRTICFYSVEDAIPFYEKRGFQKRRFQALVRDFSLAHEDFDHLSPPMTFSIFKSSAVDFSDVNAYDKIVHGIERGEYLRKWILGSQNVSFVALESTSDRVIGYISMSFASGRWDINPLYADSDDVALHLLKRAAEEVGEPIRTYVRIPADSSSAIRLFQRLRDVQHHRVLYMMSDRPLREISSDKIYSLSTVCYGLV